jgi:deoxyribonuclease V
MDAGGRVRMPVTPREAREFQVRLRDRVIRRGSVRPRLVAGVDVSEKDGRARGAVVVTRDLEIVEQVTSDVPLTFPYVPGLLSFRELPALLAAWKRLKTRPEAVIVDGAGYAHPRRFGLACHFGILVGLPTVGCAKSWFIGDYDEPAAARGSWSPLMDGDETIGAVLRTQDGRNAVYVSIGHKVSLATSIRIILDCAPKYRLPDPQRFADQLSKKRSLPPRLVRRSASQGCAKGGA